MQKINLNHLLAVSAVLFFTLSTSACSSADSKVSALSEASDEFRDEVNERKSWVQKELSRAKNDLENSRLYLAQLEANFGAARSRVESLDDLVASLELQLFESQQQLAKLSTK